MLSPTDPVAPLPPTEADPALSSEIPTPGKAADSPRSTYLTPGKAVLSIAALVALSAAALHFDGGSPAAPPAPPPQPETTATPNATAKLPSSIFHFPPGQPTAAGKFSFTPAQPSKTASPLIAPAVPQTKLPAGDPVAAAFERAAAAQKAGHLKEAVAGYEQVLMQKPGLLPAHLNLAILYNGARQPDKALPHLQAARRLDAANPAIAFQLAATLLQLQRPAEALTPLQATVKLAPANPQGWTMLAQLQTALNKPDEAFRAWAKASDLVPKDAGAAFAAGAIALDNLHKAPQAEKYLRRAISLEKRDPRGPLYLGRSLAAQGKLSAAARVLEDGVKQFPTIPDLSVTLAEVRLNRGDPSGSISALRNALHGIPETLGKGVPAGRLNMELGKQLCQSGRWKDALPPLSRAVHLLPLEPEPSSLLVQAAIRADKPQAAAAELRRALHSDPKRSDAHRALARLLVGMGQPAQASAEYSRYLAQKPNDIGVMVEAARLGESRKQWPEALAWWKKVAALLPDNPRPHLQVASLYRQLDRDADALEKYRFILQFAPDNIDALWGAAQVEEQTKRTANTLPHLRALIKASPDFGPAYEALLRIGAARNQLPSALNFLKQQLGRDPEHLVAYATVLDYYSGRNVEDGRTWVKAIIERHPKAIAPRRALDEFDLARARKKLHDLRNAKPTPAPLNNAPATDGTSGDKLSPPGKKVTPDTPSDANPAPDNPKP